MSQPVVALVNDTSIYQSHFGCQLVCQAFREQLARVGLRLGVSLPGRFDLAAVKERLSSVDLVIVNGEGTIHHDAGESLIRLADSFPSVLVNCVYEGNRRLDELAAFRYVAARESLSAAELQSHGVDCQVVPDMLFGSSAIRSHVRRLPDQDLGYTDNVLKTHIRVGPIRRRFGFTANTPTVASYLDKLSSYRRVCAGRFHAAIACAVLRIPFSTWDSNTWKTRGLMCDMRVSHLHFPTFREAYGNVPRELDPRIIDYADQAEGRIRAMFDRIAALASESKRG